MSSVMGTATHNARRRSNGQYAKWPACDACGKPVNDEERHYTDDTVCQGSDGPGFFLCGRVRCDKRIEKVDAGREFNDPAAIEARRDLYTRQRKANETAIAKGEKPKAVSLGG